MNKYTDLRNRQQEEVNAFPLGFAFSQKQFEEMMVKFGLKTDDYDKIYNLGGGCFMRKSDGPAYDDMGKRQAAELEREINAEDTGDDFCYCMFSCELANHEYGYTYELDDTLSALGMTLEQIKNNKHLRAGLNKALRKYHDGKYAI